MAEETHINREAHDKSKGFRLQKLRAVELMIESEKMPDDTVMFWAIEKHEDVYQNTDGDTLLEEDKSYNENSTFTFNSIEVKKALISFVDLWIHYEYSQRLKFNFYSSNKIGKERDSLITTAEKIVLPIDKLIDLASEDELSDEFISISKSFVLYWLKETYKETSEKFKAVSDWTDENWRSFFKLITWKFEEANEEDLNNLVLHKIKSCKWFSSTYHHDLEDYIKSKLIDELDQRQNKKDFFNRIVTKSDVELVFEKIKNGSTLKKNDVLWKMWASIEVPTDKRNVIEKLKSRWGNISNLEILKFSKKAAQGGIERESYSGENGFMALRYRVYDFCQDKLNELIIQNTNLHEIYDAEQCIGILFDVANKEIVDLKKTFSYGFDSDALIYNIILELIDNCYLAFDNE